MYRKASLSIGLTVIRPRSRYVCSCRTGRTPPAAALLVQQARLVGGHHVLDVDEGILPSITLEGFQGLLDQVTNALPLPLAVVNAVPGVHWFR